MLRSYCLDKRPRDVTIAGRVNNTTLEVTYGQRA